MRIYSIDFKNYRKSVDKCALSINKQTLIVGKNNTSKTSVVEIMTKFLTNTSSFKISDFNYKIIKKSFVNDLYDKYKSGEKELLFKFPFIEMNISLEIDKDDNLASIKDLLYEFDNNEKIIIEHDDLVTDSMLDFDNRRRHMILSESDMKYEDVSIVSLIRTVCKQTKLERPKLDLLSLEGSILVAKRLKIKYGIDISRIQVEKTIRELESKYDNNFLLLLP